MNSLSILSGQFVGKVKAKVKVYVNKRMMVNIEQLVNTLSGQGWSQSRVRSLSLLSRLSILSGQEVIKLMVKVELLVKTFRLASRQGQTVRSH